uniref:Reverse transcriptase domain-containing protein n=1 Tax=Tanacetum cinerariifolium TaxID=118510 RepID=A0A6L2J9L5_TANCI|nr:hypothetical protein [Tanacetum cinerariifolium]
MRNLTLFQKHNSNEVIKSSVEDLVLIPSESEGILDNMCDLPFSDKNHFNVESDLIKYFLTRDTLIVYSPKIDSLLKEFVGELAHIDPIPSGIDETDSDPKDDIRFIEQLLYDDTSKEVKDEILRAKLLNIHLLIAKIESLNNKLIPDCVLKSPSSSFLSYTDNSSPEFETFSYHIEETSSGSTTTHADNSLLEYDSFLFEIEPDRVSCPGLLWKLFWENLIFMCLTCYQPTPPFCWIRTSFLLMIPLDSILKFLFLPELETRILIWGYSLKSNPIDFHLGILFSNIRKVTL